MSGLIHKGSWLKTILKHGKWYMFSSLLTKGIGFFLLPIYAKYLTTEDYGILTSLNSLTRLLPIFISLYLDSAFGRFFHDIKDNKKQLRELYSTIFWFVLSWGSIIVLISIIISFFWFEKVFNLDAIPLIFFLFLTPLFSQLVTLGIVFLRQELKSKITTILEFFLALVGGGTTVVFLVIFDWGVSSKIFGAFIASFIILCFLVFYFIKSNVLVFTFDFKILKKSLIFSIPLIPNIAGGWIAGLSDRLVIAAYDGFDSTGVYGFAAQIALILYVIQDAMTQVQGPISISGLISDKERTLQNILKSSYFMWSFMLLVCFGSYLFSKEFVIIIGRNRFIDSYRYIPILGMAYVISTQNRIFTSIIVFYKKNWIISSAGITSAILNLLLNIILVPRFGAISAAYATIGSTFSYVCWILFWANKLEPMRIRFRYYIVPIIIFLGLIYISSNIITSKEVSLGIFFIKLLILSLIAGIFTFICKRLIGKGSVK